MPGSYTVDAHPLQRQATPVVRPRERSGRSLLVITSAVLVINLYGAPAAAEVTEPNGVVVPLNSNNGETQLSELFSQRNEAIDFVADGSPTPDTFSPLCDFSATFVLKQSGSSLGVGWYNVPATGADAPAASDIIEIVPAGSPVGTVVAGSDIRNDPRFLGGSIGFALLRSPPYFSEARHNPVCSLCLNPGPWTLAVTYPSTVQDNAYYVAFEDGEANIATWSNDGDFNDYVFLFAGLSCQGAGAPCAVDDAHGICRAGVTECDLGGALICKPTTAPTTERCDAIDNDCDGEADEGDQLCANGQVCSRGQCVPRCGDEEFVCTQAPFTACEGGLCVEPDCVGVDCPSGESCVAGQCAAPCDSVLCPAGQVCRAGQCVDPCAGIPCPTGRVCQGGACLLHCDCSACSGELACDTDSGLCVQPDCIDTQCGPGDVCQAGRCVDRCQGTQCPNGTTCELGECRPTLSIDQDAGSPPIGGSSGTGGQGSGTGGQDTAGFLQSAAGSLAGGAMHTSGGAGGGGAKDASIRMPVDDRGHGTSGCACAVGQEGARGWSLSMWLVTLVGLGRLRRARGH